MLYSKINITKYRYIYTFIYTTPKTVESIETITNYTNTVQFAHLHREIICVSVLLFFSSSLGNRCGSDAINVEEESTPPPLCPFTITFPVRLGCVIGLATSQRHFSHIVRTANPCTPKQCAKLRQHWLINKSKVSIGLWRLLEHIKPNKKQHTRNTATQYHLCLFFNNIFFAFSVCSESAENSWTDRNIIKEYNCKHSSLIF